MALPAVVRLLRPKQWTKNLLVFAAPLFTGSFEPSTLTPVFLAFVAMCLASSGTYVINDLRDAEKDRLHPKKKNRPIASGEVGASLATALAFLLVAGAVAVAFLASMGAMWVLLGYLLLQAIYNFGLKLVPIADVFVIALGFVLRAVIGAVALNVAISGWLLFVTAALALMLGFSKRRDEFLRLGDSAPASRESLAGYSKPILDQLVVLFAGAAMLSYGIYSVESPTAQAHPALIGTTLAVWYGICRYLYLVFHGGAGEEPEVILLTDWHILLSVGVFLVMAALAVTNVISPTFLTP